MMELFKYINEPVVGNVVIVAAYFILNYKVNHAIKKIDHIKSNCESRFKWCLDHFSPTQKKGGDDNV